MSDKPQRLNSRALMAQSILIHGGLAATTQFHFDVNVRKRSTQPSEAVTLAFMMADDFYDYAEQNCYTEEDKPHGSRQADEPSPDLDAVQRITDAIDQRMEERARRGRHPLFAARPRKGMGSRDDDDIGVSVSLVHEPATTVDLREAEPANAGDTFTALGTAVDNIVDRIRQSQQFEDGPALTTATGVPEASLDFLAPWEQQPATPEPIDPPETNPEDAAPSGEDAAASTPEGSALVTVGEQPDGGADVPSEAPPSDDPPAMTMEEFNKVCEEIEGQLATVLEVEHVPEVAHQFIDEYNRMTRSQRSVVDGLYQDRQRSLEKERPVLWDLQHMWVWDDDTMRRNFFATVETVNSVDDAKRLMLYMKESVERRRAMVATSEEKKAIANSGIEVLKRFGIKPE